jgi:hypothetical protein
MAAQSVAAERAGQAEKHITLSIHLLLTSVDKCR